MGLCPDARSRGESSYTYMEMFSYRSLPDFKSVECEKDCGHNDFFLRVYTLREARDIHLLFLESISSALHFCSRPVLYESLFHEILTLIINPSPQSTIHLLANRDSVYFFSIHMMPIVTSLFSCRLLYLKGIIQSPTSTAAETMRSRRH